MGIHYFLIFALKHRLWVFVRTASMCTHNICFEQKYENSQIKSHENCHFYSPEKSLYIAWACFCNGQHEQRSDNANAQADTCICCSSQLAMADRHGHSKYI